MSRVTVTASSTKTPKVSETPRSFAQKLIRKHPRDTREKFEDRFIDFAIDDVDFNILALRTLARQLHGNLTTTRVKRSREQRLAAAPALLMDAIMANGKKFGDCTFSEIGKFGAAYTKIASMGKPHEIVRKILTERQIKKALT